MDSDGGRTGMTRAEREGRGRSERRRKGAGESRGIKIKEKEKGVEDRKRQDVSEHIRRIVTRETFKTWMVEVKMMRTSFADLYY